MVYEKIRYGLVWSFSILPFPKSNQLPKIKFPNALERPKTPSGPDYFRIGFGSVGFRNEENIVGEEHPDYPGRIKSLHMRREVGKKSPWHFDLPRVFQLRVLLRSSADAEQRPCPRCGRALVESWMGGGRG